MFINDCITLSFKISLKKHFIDVKLKDIFYCYSLKKGLSVLSFVLVFFSSKKEILFLITGQENCLKALLLCKCWAYQSLNVKTFYITNSIHSLQINLFFIYHKSFHSSNQKMKVCLLLFISTSAIQNF